MKARDLNEGTFALGYLHARDRLVQITLTGLAARGELMSVLGDVPIARLIDHSSRALGLGRDVEQQVAQCTPESQALLAAYADGFNAGARARGYPLLLRIMGVPRMPFSAERVLEVYRFVTYFGLTSMTVSTELVIAELAARGAPRRLFDRLLGPNAQGIDLEALKQLQIPKALSFFELGAGGSTQAGSNAFAVSGQRSSTGGALLSGEFHMEVGKFPAPALCGRSQLRRRLVLVRHHHPGLPLVRRGSHCARGLVVHLRACGQRRLHLRTGARR